MEKIEKLLAPYVDLSLECDGLVRVITYLFNKNGIEHQVFSGEVVVDDVRMPLHYWVVLANGQYVDYRIRMWFGNDERNPHGIFDLKDYDYIEYRGESVDIDVSDDLFAILTTLVGKQDDKLFDVMIKNLRGY